MHKLYQLKNGLKILLVPYTGSQAVAVFVAAKVGSKYEKKDINGISHFLEHMVFKATKTMADQTELAEVIEKIGGVFNGFTSEEYTCYYAKVANQYLKTAIDWVADLYLHPLIPTDKVNKEKDIIIEEINMYKDNPMTHVYNIWQELLYGDQPAGWPIAGSKKSVKNIKHKDLVEYLRRNYTSANTLICLAGNFDSNKAKRLLHKAFEDIRSARPNTKPKLIEKQTGPQMKFFAKKTDQTHLLLGVKTFNVLNPKKYPLWILANTLGGMMSSRLFVKVREKLGLAYYVSTFNEENTDSGYLATKAGVDNKNALAAVRAILNEYKDIRDKGISDDELKKAKDFLKGQTVLALESCEALATYYSSQELCGEKIKTPKEMFEKIDKVSKSDILKVAKEIFVPSRINLAMVGPKQNINQYKKLLNSF